MTAETKRPPQAFELKAGPMPKLKPAAPAAEPEAAGPAAERPDGAQLESLSPREVILRVVEAVKAL